MSPTANTLGFELLECKITPLLPWLPPTPVSGILARFIVSEYSLQKLFLEKGKGKQKVEVDSVLNGLEWHILRKTEGAPTVSL